ncbi:MAG: hypothetical protein RMA76_31035 [Deltaproteobacteria bacterium]
MITRLVSIVLLVWVGWPEVATATPPSDLPGPFGAHIVVASNDKLLTRAQPLQLELRFALAEGAARVRCLGLDAEPRVVGARHARALATDSERSGAVELMVSSLPGATEVRVPIELVLLGRYGAGVRCEVWGPRSRAERTEATFVIDDTDRVRVASELEIVSAQWRALSKNPRRLRRELEATKQLPFRLEHLRGPSEVLSVEDAR